MYTLIYSKIFVKQLKKLPNNIQKRIYNALEKIRIRPQHYIERLVGSPFYKFRVGDYRIILEIDQGKIQILVIKIGHRKNIYDS